MASGPEQRSRLLTAAAFCVLIVALLAVLVHAGWGTLEHVDRGLGTPAESWSLHHHGAVVFLLAVELMFGTVGTVIYMLALVGVLWLTGHRRSVVWTVAVMIGTSATTTAMKLLFRRQRPQWEDSVHTLTSFSFPSGHASGIASGMGVVAVLATLYVRRGALRHAVFAAAAVLVVLVGADRILLGVHNLSDVLAGYAVAGFWIFTMLALYPPEASHPILARSQTSNGQYGRPVTPRSGSRREPQG
jgi:membrane-associated phospholipid phosphatase